ncbi:MAG: hypothetical protein WBE26_01700 [Phycisphaerae bacterium]
MNESHRLGVAILLNVFTAAVCVDAAELTVGDLSMTQGTTAEVVVSGGIAGESTYGVRIMVEIIPRGGAVGTVLFTPSPPMDIVQLDDPWPGAGTFTPYDTDNVPSDAFNGCVDDNGTFIPEPLTFSGPMASFPVVASPDADGVWDVVLDTAAGYSTWELEVPTTLGAATITVTPGEDVPTISAWGLAVITLLLLAAGTILIPQGPIASRAE